jgi:ABC-type bacteriocin/lantibiotic exporter with double-glycine peptidase domain
MAMNTCIYHQVPIMIQPQTWACWYTSLQMVVRYYRQKGRGKGLIDPSEDSETQALYTSNTGISDRERIARKLGFTVGYFSLNNEGMWGLLNDGPVIYAGRWPTHLSGHWVVIVGISENTLEINNPAVGLQSWDYNYFMGRYLLQTAERPLVYAP